MGCKNNLRLDIVRVFYTYLLLRFPNYNLRLDIVRFSYTSLRLDIVKVSYTSLRLDIVKVSFTSLRLDIVKVSMYSTYNEKKCKSKKVFPNKIATIYILYCYI